MKHEQSFADAFNAFMRRKAAKRGCRFHSFSLDGQDRDAGADYVLTDSARFAIVEFKYSASDLVTEKYKPRRLTLCRELLKRPDMRRLHDRCHFVSWTGYSGGVETNIYRREICTKAVFGDSCGLSARTPTEITRVTASVFADDFFNVAGKRSLSREEFDTYVAWVLGETSASTKTTLELMAYSPTSEDLTLVRLNSIAEAEIWVRTHVNIPISI